MFYVKRRYLYTFLYAIPGLFVSLGISLLIFAMAAGFVWLFIHGDESWPDTTNNTLVALFLITFLMLWLGSIVIAYRVGKTHEKDSTFNANHVFLAIALTILPISLMALQQFNVGNIGAKSDSAICSDFCVANGYSASEMPPKNSGDRSCICLDSVGEAAIKVPLIELED